MALPTSRYRVAAAQAAASLLGSVEVSRAAALSSFGRAATDGLFQTGDLVDGLDLLVELGLVLVVDGRIIPGDGLSEFARVPRSAAVSVAVDLHLSNHPPTWLQTAASGASVISAFVPTDDLACLVHLIPDPAEREVLLLGAARRVDSDHLAAIGAAGETAVVAGFESQLLAADRPDLAAGVRRVSLISDQLGYDVTAPMPTGEVLRVEVKATVSDAVGRFFLSRNEARVGTLDDAWRLVVCRVVEGQGSVVGWCRYSAIRAQLPVDCHPGRWATTEVTLCLDDLTPGLPS